MQSLRELYRIGQGPSSSHTMGPRRAAERFRARFPTAATFRVSLSGSLAATGKGHLTDKALNQALDPVPVLIDWHSERPMPDHPNGMHFEALDAAGDRLGEWTTYSVGGGALSDDAAADPVYRLQSANAVLEWCEAHGTAFWEYVVESEGKAILDYLDTIWETMGAAVRRGLKATGALPGGLGISRKARTFRQRSATLDRSFREEALLAAYAFAVAEENAAGGIIATAPTCGAAGILPAVLTYMGELLPIDRDDIIRALATAGLIGNLAKNNGSISGAEVGCQGEVGVACSMAAAAVAQLHGGSPRQIEYAAEMGLEHHLGLTCDPVGGMVQIPCIERNVHAATRAVDCARFALLTDGHHRISYDEVVAVMLETGQALPCLYRETSTGGLARIKRPRA